MTETATLPLWRNRDYVILLAGQGVSNAGTFASQVAFPLLVLWLTGSSLQAGLVAGLERVPFLLLTLPAGALVDRWNRKTVMIVCDSVRTLAFASIPLAALAGRLNVPLVYAVSLVEGTAFAFFNLCEAASLPRVVPREQIPAAKAASGAAFGTAAFVGPSLGGVLYGLGRTLPFLADAVSYAASTISLLFIRASFQGERVATGSSVRSEIAEGVAWLWHQPLLRFMAFLTGGINLLDAPWVLVLVVLGQRELHASPAAIGLALGVGSMAEIGGALFGGWVQKRLSFGRAVAGACWGFGLAWSLITFAPNLVVVALLVGAAAFAIPTYEVVQFSYRLALIPDALQGRVNSIYRLIAVGTMPVGQVLVGAVLQLAGPRATILYLGAGFCMLALSATLNPRVRHAPRVV